MFGYPERLGGAGSGAGTFDGVFIGGITAVMLARLL